MRDELLTTTSFSAWPIFLKAHAVLVDLIEQELVAQGLPSLAWYDVLWTLEQAADQRLRMSELAGCTVITPSNLTRLVDRMERSRVVRRDRVVGDRRGTFAILTAKGRRQRAKIWRVYEPLITSYFDQHLKAAEALVLHRVLLRVTAAAKH